MKKFLLLCAVLICYNSVTIAQSKKELKAEQDAKEFQAMNDLIDSKNYEFQADWATSQNGRRFNLNINANTLIVKNDSANIYLPYYGTMTSGGAAMTSDGGIKFFGPVDSYTKTVDKKKQKINVKFNASSSTDRYEFNITIFKGGNSLVILNSNYRSVIKYDGQTGEIREKKKDN